MSELEPGHRARFPLRERSQKLEEGSHLPNKINEIESPIPGELRESYLKEYDANETFADSQELLSCFSKAEQAYHSGLDSKAHELYSQCVRLGVYNPNILFTCFKNLGNIMVRLGDFDAAEELYNKAYTINPDSDILLINLGTLEIQKRNYEKALERYRQAVDLNPSNEKGWIGLAIIHREYGDLSLAWGNLENALDLNPFEDTAIELMVQWGVKDSRLESIISRLHFYAENRPNQLHIQETLAKVLVVGGRLRQAKTIIDKILSINPQHDEFKEIAKNIDSALSVKR